MAPEARVVPLEREHARAVGQTLAASHADYPAFSHVFPDPEARRRALTSFFRGVARDAARFPDSSVAVADSRLVEAALWLPPGAFPWIAARKLRAVPALLSVFRAAPRRFSIFTALGRNTERLHPADPHWYLEVLGVRPDRQGQRIGTRLLEPGLASAAADGLPVYLETSRGENVAFYERLGFRVVDDELPLVPGGPTHWAMRRPGPGR